MKVIAAIKHDSGAIGLWQTLNLILKEEVNSNDDYFIFCEDDHLFTKDYSIDFLQRCINEARQRNADILLGGISWFDIAVQISEDLFWVNNFSGTQFVIFFNKFYQKVLDVSDFSASDSMDHKISGLTDKKFFIYPFISIQKDFGYSDATQINNRAGRVRWLFENTSRKVRSLSKVRTFYSSNS